MKKGLLILLVLFYLSANSQTRYWSHFYLPNINCLKTTEPGEDEIYLLVTWKASYGSEGTVRLPASGHWDMNDGNRDISNRNLGQQYGFMLADGESIDFVMTIMEEDGGAPEQYLKIGSAILSKAPGNNPIVATCKGILDALASIANVLQIKDTDDWVGSIQYHVSQNNGQITTTSFGVYNPNDNSQGENEKMSTNKFRLTGDGSQYIVTTEVTKD